MDDGSRALAIGASCCYWLGGMRQWIGALGVALCSLLLGCGADSKEAEPAANTGPLEVIGQYTWADGGEPYYISEQSWDGGTILEYDNGRNRAVLDEVEAGYGFAVMFWIPPKAGKLFTCRIAYGLETAEEARSSTKVPSTGTPATSGCGPVAWNEFNAN